jgi:hypothetical protein
MAWEQRHLYLKTESLIAACLRHGLLLLLITQREPPGSRLCIHTALIDEESLSEFNEKHCLTRP